MAFQNLKPRIVTASVLIGVIAALELFSYTSPYGRLLFSFIAFLIIILAIIEYGKIISMGGKDKSLFIASSLLLAIPSYSLLVHFSDYVQSVFGNLPYHIGDVFPLISSGYIIALIGSFFIGLLFAYENLERPTQIIRDLLIGVSLVGLGGGAIVALTLTSSHGPLYWVIGVVASSDIGAYFGGSKLGGPKLIPIISPGKTISGAIVGVVVGTLVGVLLLPLIGIPGMSWPEANILSFAVTVASQVTDLMESFVKRIYGVKDSGSLLPGHGGMLDRIDALLGGSICFMSVTYLLFG